MRKLFRPRSLSTELGFCLVADGMGGAAAGEIASRIFTETTLELFLNSVGRSEKETIELVKRAFSFANERILSHVKKNLHHLSTSTLLQKVEKLIESANAAGGYDNITVVLFEIPPLPPGDLRFLH